jgi:gamma-glutamyltranspeptidase / glutathione hydrolase
MVASSQTRATRVGVDVLQRGGNAADAAVAVAAMLCVTEPTSTGLGGDAFALVWAGGEVSALDAAGPAPLGADPEAPVEARGPRSVTVPGAVGGWAALLERHGTWGLDACLAPAVDAAHGGIALGHHAARMWSESVSVPAPLPGAPAAGEELRLPDLATTLGAIADDGPAAFYTGPVAEAIAAASWLEPQDLQAYAPAWVTPLRLAYHGVDVLESPPPTQGVAALEALGLLDELGGGFRAQLTAAQLALADARDRVRDGDDVTDLLAPAALRARARQAPAPVGDPLGGTVYLCVVDGDGMAVSFIQSLAEHFGSGVIAHGTGVVLNNRGAYFATQGGAVPGRRPYHTTIPGLLLREGRLLGPFGVMGGFLQAQAHMQLVAALVDEGLDAQAALDRPRFRIDGPAVHLERGLWDRAEDVRALGLEPIEDTAITPFGGGQAIMVRDDHLEGGSDRRKDGCAAGVR